MALNPKVVAAKKLQYLPAIWQGENKSGCTPIGDKILIMPDIALSQSAGGVHMPDDFKERMQLSTQSGVIVAVGDDAFTWSADRSRPFGGYKPKVGDRVYYEKYAGAVVNGDDGMDYRLIEDKQIGAVIEVKK
jgi:chaperonin GroES